MLNENQLSLLKSELLEMKKSLTTTAEETDNKDGILEATSELSMYDNHPGDLGTELFEREKDAALNVHANSELEKVSYALQAMQEESYGICEVCEKEIPFERLEAVPHTTLCIEHATEQEIPQDRPVEDDILKMAKPNSFANRESDAVNDGEDSFQEIAKSGTSETPSDFVGDHADYDSMYAVDIDDGAVEAIEEIASANMSGHANGFIWSDSTTRYESELDNLP